MRLELEAGGHLLELERRRYSLTARANRSDGIISLRIISVMASLDDLREEA
jgi:hypothetical protein